MRQIDPGTPLPPAHPSDDTMKLLAERRSVPAPLLAEPGPAPDRLDALLHVAARVPDHRMVVPFRFVVLEGAARERFTKVLRRAAEARDDVTPDKLSKQARIFEASPCIVTVLSSVDPEHKTPEWEQVLTAGAVCQNLLIAASASGFAGQWLTGWMAYDDEVGAAFGRAENERIAGFIFLGTATDSPQERPRPKLSEIVTRWEG